MFDWENYLRKVCMVYYTSVHSSMGYMHILPQDKKQDFHSVSFTERWIPIIVDHRSCSILKEVNVDAYSNVRHQLQTFHEWQQEVGPGGSITLQYLKVNPQSYMDWTIGPWISYWTRITVFWEQVTLCHVAHIDKLKLCHPGTRFARLFDDEVTVSEDTITKAITKTRAL